METFYSHQGLVGLPALKRQFLYIYLDTNDEIFFLNIHSPPILMKIISST